MATSTSGGTSSNVGTALTPVAFFDNALRLFTFPRAKAASGSFDALLDMTVTVQGQTLMTGRFVNADGSTDGFVMRLNGAEPDLSFGGTGFLSFDLGAGNDQFERVYALPNGKVLLTGFTNAPVGTPGADARGDFVALQLNADGTPDTTFGTNGRVTVDLGGHDYAWGSTLLSNGSLVLVGEVGGAAIAQGPRIALVRLTPSGQIDTTFGTDGKVLFGQGLVGYTVHENAGKLVVAGFSIDEQTTGQFVVARFNADGSADTSFSGDGVATIAGASGGFSVAFGSVPLAGGKTLVYGNTFNAESPAVVFRLNADGTLDTSFGIAGMVQIAQLSGSDIERSMVALPDGKFLLAGRADGDGSIRLVRLMPDGAIDTSFGNAGLHTYQVSAGSNIGPVRHVVLPDGQIVVAVGGTDASGRQVVGVTAASTYREGSDANDTLYGSRFADDIRGSAGDDYLFGRGGPDLIFGGDGRDFIEAGTGEANDADTIDGGAGYDVVRYSHFGQANSVTFTSTLVTGRQLDPVSGDVDVLLNFEELHWAGGSGGDRFIGGAERNYIQGEGGSDTLTGGGGNDTFWYGFYSSGQSLGQDVITDFGAGDDISFGAYGRFNFTRVANNGNPALLKQGEVMLQTSANSVVVHIGADTVPGADASITLQGTFDPRGFGFYRLNSDFTELRYEPGQNLTGTKADDYLQGGVGPDTITGGAGFDNLYGRGGPDLIFGGDDGDFIEAGTGEADDADTIDGGAGYDTVRYSYSTQTNPVTFTSTFTTGSQLDPLSGVVDSLTNVEQLNWAGGSGNDRFVGGSEPNFMEGMGGADTLTGGGGNDTFWYGFYSSGQPLGQDVITDFGAGDVVSFGAYGRFNFTRVVNNGNPALLKQGEVMLQISSTSVVVHVGADTAPGADASITLQGTFDARSFAFNGLNSDYVNLRYEPGQNLTGTAAGDFLQGGAGADTINGGAGSDNLYGRGGPDQIFGGDDGDFIEAGTGEADDADTIDGGAGYDVVRYSHFGQANPVTFTSTLVTGRQLDPVSGDVDVLLNFEELHWAGGSGGDRFIGGAERNYIQGEGGSDTLTGGGGNDTFWYGFYSSGQSLGQDVITDFGAGDDISFGAYGRFNFTRVANNGNPALLKQGEVMLQTSATSVVVHIGADTVAGADASITLQGTFDARSFAFNGLNSDYVNLRYEPGQNLTGAAGNDTLQGGAGPDTINGGPGFDAIFGQGGSDLIFGGDDGDYIEGGYGEANDADTIDGGAGYDLVYYSYYNQTTPVVFTSTLASGRQVDPLSGDVDVLSNIEELHWFGGSAGDRFIGGAERNFIDGRGGSDTLTGGGGDDTFSYNFYADGLRLDDDFITDFSKGDDIQLQSHNRFKFTRVADNGNPALLKQGEVMLQTSATSVVVHIGADTVPGADTTVTLQGAFDLRSLVFSGLNSGSVNLRYEPGQNLTGAAGNDTLIGGIGADTLTGGAGDDYLQGDGGPDLIFGGEGGDFIEGRIGLANDADTLDGGPGYDIVNYSYGGQTTPVVFTSTLSSGRQVDPVTGDVDVLSNFEELHWFGSSAGDRFIGGNERNFIQGQGGADTLTGGGGSDTFWYYLHPSVTPVGNDLITDFGAGDDVALNSGGGFNFTRVADNTDPAVLKEGQYTFQTFTDRTVLHIGADSVNGADATVTFAGNFNPASWTIINSLSRGLTYIRYEPGLTLGGTAANDVLRGADKPDSISGGDGDDLLVGGGGSDVLSGGAGNDQLIGYLTGSGISGADDGADSLDGGDGNDVLRGNAGHDTLRGGAGDDNLRGDEGDDLLDGGAGYDFVSYRFDQIQNQTAGVRFDASSLVIGSNTPQTLLDGLGGTDTLIGVEYIGALGSPLNDSITGSEGNDQLFGEGGNDSIIGGGGQDYVVGGNGNDTLQGGDGNDLVVGDQGNDVLDGQAGNDGISGGSGNDLLTGGGGLDSFKLDLTDPQGPGNDTITDFSDDDTITYYAPNSTTLTRVADNGNPALLKQGEVMIQKLTDRVVIHVGADSVPGADVQTTLLGSLDPRSFLVASTSTNTQLTFRYVSGKNKIGNSFADSIIGGEGPDTLRGEGGDDAIFGGDGPDLIYGGPGNDGITVTSYLSGGAGADTIYGEDGDDFLSGYLGNSGVSNDGDLPDLLDGGAGNDTLRGNAGADTLLGGTGNDNLRGDAGSDWIDGGEGVDLAAYRFDEAGAPVGGTNWSASTLVLGSNTPQLLADGLGGTDTLLNIEGVIATGGAGPDTLTGSAGGDQLTGNAGNDRLFGGAGNDTIFGGTGDDSLDGGIGNDTVFGDDGADSIDGGLGDDLLNGAAGTDRLDGGAGADTLYGGAGNDMLEGGAGNDVAQFDLPRSSYTITANAITRTVTVASSVVGGEGVDTLTNVESIRFSDGLVNVSSLFNAAPSLSGLPTTAQTVTSGVNASLADFQVADTDTPKLSVTLNPNGGTIVGLADSDPAAPGIQLSGTPAELNALIALATFTSNGLGAASIGVSVTDGLSDAVEGTYPLMVAANRINGTTGADTLNGLSGADSILGGDGNDTLKGNAGDDTLEGGNGDDLLEGGAGADRMAGGLGNDTYFVTDASDVVVEAAAQGSDSVMTSLAAYTLGSNVESLRSSLSSSTLVRQFTGNELANTLSGAAGADTLMGLAGNDSISGLDGDDEIIGGAGRDTLVGGAGADRFVFRAEPVTSSPGAALSAPGGATASLIGGDIITGFEGAGVAGGDVISLSRSAFKLTSAIGAGFSVASEFASVANDAAVDGSSALIVFSRATGKLYFNASAANGDLVLLATLTGVTNLTAGDFGLTG